MNTLAGSTALTRTLIASPFALVWLASCRCPNTQHETPGPSGDADIGLVEEGRFACMGRLEIDDPFGQKATMYYVPCGPVHELNWRSSPFAGLGRLDSDKRYDPIAHQLKYMLMILDERKSVVAIGFVYKSGLVRIDKVGAKDGAGRIVVGSLGESQWFGPVAVL